MKRCAVCGGHLRSLNRRLAGAAVLWVLAADDVDGDGLARLDQIPEYDGDYWQVQYLLQILPEPRPAHGVWHEIKLEVRSKENLRGNEIIVRSRLGGLPAEVTRAKFGPIRHSLRSECA